MLLRKFWSTKNSKFKIVVLLLGSLITFQLSSFALPLFNFKLDQKEPQEDIVTRLLPLAKTITVKIKLPEGFGSGVLLDRKNSLYTVLTNAHVISGSQPPYLIETFDGKIHSAHKIEIEEFNNQDIAILQFSSPDLVYPIALLGNPPQEGEFVAAGGFVAKETDNLSETNLNSNTNTQDYLLLPGQITLVLEKPLEQGYQIGYTNEVIDGMSGGAILNIHGQLIGINAMRAYALLGDPYIFQDGSIPCESLRDIMIRSSWGIAITKVLEISDAHSDLIPTQKQ